MKTDLTGGVLIFQMIFTMSLEFIIDRSVQAFMKQAVTRNRVRCTCSGVLLETAVDAE